MSDTPPVSNVQTDPPLRPRSPSWWMGVALVLGVSLVALAPTTGDFGLTYDEPAYTFSQHVSGQWWELLTQARSWDDLRALADPDTLLMYWPYARHGINFHPPLAGQFNLLTHQLFGGFLKDTVARRMASVIAFALTVTLLAGFLARRYGWWVGGVAGACLLFMPRLYAQAHLIDTDIPGLCIWVAAAFAFWKGMYETNGRAARLAFGVLVGLAFLEKLATVAVLVPVLLWWGVDGFRQLVRRRVHRSDVLDALLTIGAMAVPLLLALLEILRLKGKLPQPNRTDLFRDRPESYLPGWILSVPLAVWLVRRLLARLRPSSPVWGVERPRLETLAALVAFPPVVAWLGNPLWWQETLTRLAHYYAISVDRKGALPNIQILYFGEIFEYSAPWHNGWVLLAITVPAGILIAALVGVVYAIRHARQDQLPIYFLVHMLTLPMLRMLPTPAHDGVRLFLPTFAFLAGFAGWGVVWLGDFISRLRIQPRWSRSLVAALVVGSAAWELAAIHPYGLSYYNAFIGGVRGAWQRGFEVTYWYDAFTPKTLAELNRRLPPDAHVNFPNQLSAPATFSELQALGELRGDLRFDAPGSDYPYLWLLTHDSKAMANTRLLFALTPWYAEAPRQLDGVRVLTVASPQAAARAIALQLLMDAPDRSPPEPPHAPPFVRQYAPFLARLWGDGLDRAKKLTVNEPLLDWARGEPETLRAAAHDLVEWSKSQSNQQLRDVSLAVLAWRRAGGEPPESLLKIPLFRDHPRTLVLYGDLVRFDHEAPFSTDLLKKRPQALLDAVEILCRRPDAVRAVMTRYAYTDPEHIGGYLDRDLPHEP